MPFDHTTWAKLAGIDIEKCIITFSIRLDPKKISVLPLNHWKLLKISQNGSKWTELAIFVNSTPFNHTNCAQLTGIDIEKCIIMFSIRFDPKKT